MHTDRPLFSASGVGTLDLCFDPALQPCTIAIAQQKQRAQKHPPGTNVIRTTAKGSIRLNHSTGCGRHFPLTIEGTIYKNFINTVELAEQKATKQELILDKDGMKQLLDSIDTSNIIGLRDLAYRT